MRISMQDISSLWWANLIVPSEDQKLAQVGSVEVDMDSDEEWLLGPSTQGTALLKEEWAPGTPSHTSNVLTSLRQPRSYSTVSMPCCHLDSQLSWAMGDYCFLLTAEAQSG